MSDPADTIEAERWSSPSLRHMGTETADIVTERIGSTEVLTLNRPESLNAFTPSMLDLLDRSLRTAAADRDCRAIVLTGAGDRAFCAGVDVKGVAAQDDARRSPGDTAVDPTLAGFESLHLGLSQVVRTIHSIPVPVIAAVNGHAVGGGFALVAAADLRIASNNATFSDGFVKRGISGCEMGLSYFLPKLVGASVAFEWMLTGRRVEADEARHVGFVGRVVEGSELLAAACELGEMLAANAPMAISTTKEVMWTNLHAGNLDHALALESRNQIMTRATADAAEARASFLEKRRPDFSNPATPRPLR